MRPAVNLQQLAFLGLDEAARFVASLGIDAVEIWPSNADGGACEEDWHRYKKKDVDAAAETLHAHGLDIACVTLGFFALPLALKRAGTAAMTEALVGTVDTAARVHAPLVNCYLAGVPARMFVEAVKPAAEHAVAKGVTIVVENEAHDDSALSGDVAAIVDGVESPGFRTVYDPCNYYQADDEPYPGAYETLGGRIAYVHMKGGSRFTGAEH
jgi:sugar phosphate isomerase/epimerase